MPFLRSISACRMRGSTDCSKVKEAPKSMKLRVVVPATPIVNVTLAGRKMRSPDAARGARSMGRLMSMKVCRPTDAVTGGVR